MPIIKSAKKALRQSIRRRERNLIKREAYKKEVKRYKKAVAAGKIDEAEKMLPLVYKTLDKAAKTNVVHRNKASRLKSHLGQLITKAKSASS